MLGLGGELAKEVNFVFMSCNYYVQAHFCAVQWLAGSPFYESCYTLQLTFSKFGPVFATKTFCGFA